MPNCVRSSIRHRHSGLLYVAAAHPDVKPSRPRSIFAISVVGRNDLPAHLRESLRDDRRRCFDRWRGFALADVYGIFAPVTRVGPYRSEIEMGLGRIKIARIKVEAVGRFQLSMIVVSDMTATRPAFRSFYAWTRHAQVGGARVTRQQTSCGRENKCCDKRLCHNRSPPPARPSDATPPRQIRP